MLMRKPATPRREEPVRKPDAAPQAASVAEVPEPRQVSAAPRPQVESRNGNRRLTRSQLYDLIDAGRAAAMSRDQPLLQIQSAIRQPCDDQRFQLPRQEEELIAGERLDELTGTGPIHPPRSLATVNDDLDTGAGPVVV